MRAASAYPCGCHIELRAAGHVIIYCLTHVAAEELVQIVQKVTEFDMGDNCQECGLDQQTCRRAEAVLLAIGRHPSRTT
jgi:hypothetical protein